MTSLLSQILFELVGDDASANRVALIRQAENEHNVELRVDADGQYYVAERRSLASKAFFGLVGCFIEVQEGDNESG